MRSVAIVDDPDRARTLVEALSDYDASVVEPRAPGLPHRYDIVVVDWSVPVAADLAADRDTRSWGVIAVVDGVSETDPIGAGADGVVVRPVHPDDIRARIDRVAVQRAYIGAVRTAATDDGDNWRAAADDLLDALNDDLAAAELFRRLL